MVSANQDKKAPGCFGAPLRWLYNNNPFYLISAGMLIYGLNVMFASREMTSDLSWTIMIILASFILLLAFSATLIIRLGKVWDDARSIIMVIILMFFALSISFDLTLIEDYDTGRLLMWAGLIFCIGTSELLLKGVNMTLHGLFKLPLYLCLAVLFLYPILISDLLQAPHDAMQRTWMIYLFNPVAALACLALLPVIRRGNRLAICNGTPWSWPWFPSPVYVMLVIGLLIRSASLTISFEPAFGDYSPSAANVSSAFGGYFLFPIAAAVILILMEAASLKPKGLLSHIVLTLPIAAAGLCWTQADPIDAVFTGFLNSFTARLAHPFTLACWVGTALYAYAWWRKLPAAKTMFVLSLATLPVTHSLVEGPLSEIIPWPISGWIVTAWLIVHHRGRWNSTRFVLTAASALFAIASTAGTALPIHSSLALGPLYLLIATMVVLIAGLFKDDSAQVYQDSGAAMIMLVFLLAHTLFMHMYAGVWFQPKLFMLGLSGLSVLYVLLTGNRLMMIALVLQGLSYVFYAMVQIALFVMRLKLSSGMMKIVLSIGFFLMAIFISLLKAFVRRQPDPSHGG
jgi:hypothetical protein